MVKVNKEGLELIKKFEGLRLKPYKCSAGVPTIGYGNTYYEDGTKVKMEDPAITKERAESLLLLIVESFTRRIRPLIKSKVSQEQFNALLSFAYNVGIGNFQKSTLLKKVNVNPDDFLTRYGAGEYCANNVDKMNRTIVSICTNDSLFEKYSVSAGEYVKNHPAVERMDEIGKEIELRLAKMREMAELPRLPEHQKLEMLDMKERIGKLKERNFRLKRKGTGNVRMLIKGNPTMVSPKYTDAFNQLKGYLADFEEKRKGKK